MTWLRRLSIFFVPMLLGLASLSGPGRAQTPSARFAFADTTLLRDTLGLHFSQLFPLADSLRLSPDTLRAISIRYVYTLERLLVLADSLGMRVDSVGPFLSRERFNVLVRREANSASFHYTSGYSLGQASSTWSNGSDWNFSRRLLLLHNTTQVDMERYLAGVYTSLRETRSSITELGWKLAEGFSLGGRAQLQRFNSLDPGSASNENVADESYQLSVRSRQRPRAGLQSELNLFTGLLDQRNSRQVKRGLSSELSGRVRVTRGAWLTNDLDGRLTANFARTRLPTSVASLNARDRSADIHGSLSVLDKAPASLNLSYAIKNSSIESPVDSGRIQIGRSKNNSLDATVRLRHGAAQLVNLTGHIGRLQQLQNASETLLQTSESTRDDRSAGADGRFETGRWTLQSHFTLAGGISRYPRRDPAGGYGESLFVRTIDATLSRPLGGHMTARATGTVSLSSYRYNRIGTYRTLPVNNDQYRQSYRIECVYSPTARANTTLALDVIRTLGINLPAASTASNSEDRTYRAEWRWTYQLLPMLTATQRNLISADYVLYSLSPSNNRLTLDYSSLTGLNAVLTPRLTLDLTHNARQQPSGLYVRQRDGLEAFSRSDEGRNYSLQARIVYTPIRGLSLSLEPSYLSIRREGAVNGALVPQRQTNSLNFSGGASLNLALAARGRLTGDIRRVARADRGISYTNGLPVLSPLSQTDFWASSLQLTWDM